MDIINLVSMILEGEDSSVDINGDGELNILDIVMCIEIILDE